MGKRTKTFGQVSAGTKSRAEQSEGRRRKGKILIFNRKNRALVILIAVLLLAIFWVAIPKCPKATRIVSDKPYFIDEVWPPPGAKIPAGCFIKRSISWPVPVIKWITESVNPDSTTPSIAVSIFPVQIIEELDEWRYFSERVLLYIDDKKIGQPTDMLEDDSPIYASSLEELDSFPDVPRWYYFGWYPVLSPGDHTARFVLIKKDGTTLEYEWKFTITWW